MSLVWVYLYCCGTARARYFNGALCGICSLGKVELYSGPPRVNPLAILFGVCDVLLICYAMEFLCGSSTKLTARYLGVPN